MSDYVWVSGVCTKTEFSMSATSDVFQGDVEAAIHAVRMAEKGQPISEEFCPNRIWADDDIDDYLRMPVNSLPPIFLVQRQWIVSESTADIIRSFDLGNGDLYLVSEGIYHGDNETRVPGNWYYWAFANLKECLLPDLSPRKRKCSIGDNIWNLPWKLDDGAIAVSKSCHDGPDVWIDPKLFKAVFFSRKLGDAFEKAGLRDSFYMAKTSVF